MAKKKGGVGAKGSAKARFFHPGEAIRKRWPNQHQTIRVSEALVVGKGVHRVNRKDQMCYECCLPEIDDNTIFHIVCSNFKVEVEGATPFENKLAVTAPVTRTNAQDGERARVLALRAAGEDVLPNIDGAHALEIAEMRQQGIKVDANNEPASENSEPAMLTS